MSINNKDIRRQWEWDAQAWGSKKVGKGKHVLRVREDRCKCTSCVKDRRFKEIRDTQNIGRREAKEEDRLAWFDAVWGDEYPE